MGEIYTYHHRSFLPTEAQTYARPLFVSDHINPKYEEGDLRKGYKIYYLNAYAKIIIFRQIFAPMAKRPTIDLNTLRHSASHILALAVKRLFPRTILGIGPATEDGFYYDFDSELNFTAEDLVTIESEMKKIIGENLPFERHVISKEEAVTLFSTEPYKLELIEQYTSEGNDLSYYNLGSEWFDLCAGPHVKCSGVVKAVKLLNLAGAYWKGDSNNKALQRVYGTAFPTQKDLSAYLVMREDALKRDHQKLGRKMGIFLTAP